MPLRFANFPSAVDKLFFPLMSAGFNSEPVHFVTKLDVLMWQIKSPRKNVFHKSGKYFHLTWPAVPSGFRWEQCNYIIPPLFLCLKAVLATSKHFCSVTAARGLENSMINAEVLCSMGISNHIINSD